MLKKTKYKWYHLAPDWTIAPSAAVVMAALTPLVFKG